MLHNLWNSLLYKPFVNVLAFLVNVIPGGDLGVAVILLTLLVKTLLYPLSQKSIESQVKMKLLEPEINKIKNSGLNKEEQARKTFDLYKEYKTNPFSGCLLVLIQIPIIFALYYVFYKGINFDIGLYSFIKMPTGVNTHFLGLIDLAGKSWVLAILAGASQFLQAHFMPTNKNQSSTGTNSFQDSFAKSMQMQMKYFFPIVIVFISYRISGAVALYWIVSNLFSVGQQIYANKKSTLDNNVVVKSKVI